MGVPPGKNVSKYLNPSSRIDIITRPKKRVKDKKNVTVTVLVIVQA